MRSFTIDVNVRPWFRPSRVGDVAPEKLAKSAVGYHLTDGAERCERCVHFKAPSACELVTGPIQRNGWCEKFDAARYGDVNFRDAFEEGEHPRGEGGKFTSGIVHYRPSGKKPSLKRREPAPSSGASGTTRLGSSVVYNPSPSMLRAISANPGMYETYQLRAALRADVPVKKEIEAELRRREQS